MSGMTVTIRAKVGLALAWVRFMQFLGPVLVRTIGDRRTLALARRGATRLVVVKVGHERWRLGLR